MIPRAEAKAETTTKPDLLIKPSPRRPLIQSALQIRIQHPHAPAQY
jgi:hypothetical protein